MRGDPLDISQLYSFAEFTRGVNAYAYTTDHLWIGHHLRFGHTKGASTPIMRGYPFTIVLSLRLYSFAEFTRIVNVCA